MPWVADQARPSCVEATGWQRTAGAGWEGPAQWCTLRHGRRSGPTYALGRTGPRYVSGTPHGGQEWALSSKPASCCGAVPGSPAACATAPRHCSVAVSSVSGRVGFGLPPFLSDDGEACNGGQRWAGARTNRESAVVGRWSSARRLRPLLRLLRALVKCFPTRRPTEKQSAPTEAEKACVLTVRAGKRVGPNPHAPRFLSRGRPRGCHKQHRQEKALSD